VGIKTRRKTCSKENIVVFAYHPAGSANRIDIPGLQAGKRLALNDSASVQFPAFPPK